MPAATQSMLGKGAKLAHGVTANSTTTYTDLTRVKNISPNRTLNETEDVTLESDWVDYTPTIGEGETTFTIRHRPGDPGCQLLLSLLDTPSKDPWRVIQPDGSKIDFTGYPKSYNKTFENREFVEAEVSMRICTKPVYTPAA